MQTIQPTAVARSRRLLRGVLGSLVVSSLLVALPALGQGRAYITNYNSHDVTVIDVATDTVVMTIPVGFSPWGVAVSSGPRVYVGNDNGGIVSAIDADTGTVVATIPVGPHPTGLALSPDGSRLYVSDITDSTVYIIDTASNSVIDTVGVAQPFGVTFSADGARVYVASAFAHAVSVLDAATHAVLAMVDVGGLPTSIVEAPGQQRLYVSDLLLQDVSVVDTTALAEVATFPGGADVYDLALSDDESRLYLAAHGTDEVLVLDTATGTLVGRVPVENGPYGIDLTPDGTRAYVANTGAAAEEDTVSVIDTATLEVVDTITVGYSPYANGEFISSHVPPAPPEGVNLAASSSPVLYAAEIVAGPDAPVTLDNRTGLLNLSAPLGYGFSPGETRYARVECTGGLVFPDDTAAAFSVGGAASIGALNGINSSAVHFSITAVAEAVTAGGVLTVTGGRAITGTDPVDCTYGLYDFPSQAAAGGVHGRVATASGPYLAFAPGTAFASDALVATADVEADPAYSRFVAASATTADAAALATLAYGPASPLPLAPDGTPVLLSDLHATGPAGTRIVVTGDFSAAANADGSFAGEALDRVYLSANDVQCVPGDRADTLDATQAVFAVGATAMHRLLCYAPLAGTPVPVAAYGAELVAVPASASYAPQDIGPLDAGAIERNGTHLQAPLAQVPEGWLSRIVLTNTGALDRPYVMAVNGETGNLVGTANLTGVVPARGTVVIDLDEVLVSFSSKRRATINVTVAGPDTDIQGQYQIVNPGKGTLSNHIMVRPGTN